MFVVTIQDMPSSPELISNQQFLELKEARPSFEEEFTVYEVSDLTGIDDIVEWFFPET